MTSRDAAFAIARILLYRHILVGAENIAFTALCGFFFIWFLRFVDPMGWMTNARTIALRRLCCVVALLKGALYTLSGSSIRYAPGRIAVAIQLPDPTEVAWLHHPPTYSIFHETPATAWVALVLITFAAVRLYVRAAGALQSVKYASVLKVDLSESDQFALQQVVTSCAAQLGKPHLGNLAIEIVRLPLSISSTGVTPRVIGLGRPRIIIDEWWCDVASSDPDAFAAVVRHELSHVLFRHQYSRWALLWLRDIALFTGLGHLIYNEVLAYDEISCDIRSTKSGLHAQALARAITMAGKRVSDAEAHVPRHRGDEAFAMLTGHRQSLTTLRSLQVRRMSMLKTRLSRSSSGIKQMQRSRTLLRSRLLYGLAWLPILVIQASVFLLFVVCLFLHIAVHPS